MENVVLFQLPNKDIFTIYTKTKCDYCRKVKLLLEDNDIEYVVINCDNYLANNRDDFLSFIKDVSCRDWKTFPIVFDDKEKFIGGFTETQKYLEKKLNFDGDF